MTKNKIITLVAIILLGIAGLAFYRLINDGIGLFLLKIGIKNLLLQNIIVIFAVIGVLYGLGIGFDKAIDKIIKR